MEEVNDNELHMEPLHYPAVATRADEAPPPPPLPPIATASAGGQVCAADRGVAGEVDAGPQACEHSIGQIEPKTPRWTRRVRTGAATPGRAPCPGWPNALEKAICGLAAR